MINTKDFTVKKLQAEAPKQLYIHKDTETFRNSKKIALDLRYKLGESPPMSPNLSPSYRHRLDSLEVVQEN